jgi:magnesium transporter
MGNTWRERQAVSPGTEVTDPAADPRITCIEYKHDVVVETEPALEEFLGMDPVVPAERVRVVVVYDYRKAELLEHLKTAYKMHSLSVEDISHTEQRSKYDSYDEYELCIINRYVRGEGKTAKRQVSVVLTKEGAVMVFVEGKEPEENISAVLDRIRNKKGRIRDREAGYAAYAFVDALLDTYFVMLEELEEEMERLDARITAEQQSQDIVKELFDLKKETLHLKRNTWPLRELVNSIQRDDNSLFLTDKRNELFIRDLQDHIYHITESADNLRDSAYSLVEMHTNFTGMRMNEIMKVLTIITTVFAPIMFLSSIYGMNFEGIWELHMPHGYAIFWLIVLALTLVQVWYFRRKKWL